MKKNYLELQDLPGQVLSSSYVNDLFHAELEKVQILHPELIPLTQNIHEDYSIFRSLRKGATARAVDQGVKTRVIDMHNRWRTVENRGGQRSSSTMQDYYTDLRLTIKTRLMFTQVL